MKHGTPNLAPCSKARTVTDADLSDFLQRLTEKIAAWMHEAYEEYASYDHYFRLTICNGLDFTSMKGKRYARIVRQRRGDSNSRSAYGFVELATGDIFKPATWKAPAKHKRGNIFDESGGLDCCGPYSVAYLKRGQVLMEAQRIALPE
jgi:hypothetical protein